MARLLPIINLTYLISYTNFIWTLDWVGNYSAGRRLNFAPTATSILLITFMVPELQGNGVELDYFSHSAIQFRRSSKSFLSISDLEHCVPTDKGDHRQGKTIQTMGTLRKTPAPMLPTILSGAAFGSALAISGVASPQIIREQFSLGDFHMLTTFLTASASSAVILAVYDSRNGTSVGTRQSSNRGWFGRFDGNLVGGSLLGVGMALTGACPGTVLVQLVSGVPEARPLIFYAIASGIFYSASQKKSFPIRMNAAKVLHRDDYPSRAGDGSSSPSSNRLPQHTIMDATGLPRWTVVSLYVALMSLLIATSSLAGPTKSPVHRVIAGGLTIGAAQYVTLALTRRTVGVSTAFEDIGDVFWDLVGKRGVKPVTNSLLFVAGIMAGARILTLIVPSIGSKILTGTGIVHNWYVSAFGAFCLVVGARLGGGCTSGHGISGMSGLSLSSIVHTMSIFGAALATGLFLRQASRP